MRVWASRTRLKGETLNIRAGRWRLMVGIRPPPPPPSRALLSFHAIMIRSSKALFDLHNQLQTFLTTLNRVAVSLESAAFTQCDYRDPYGDIQLGDSLCRLRRTVASLAAAENDLQSTLACVERKCNIMSPINQLPDEVLIQIFQLLIPSPHSHESRHRVVNAIKFSSVCRRWRDVCVGAAAFWGPLHSLRSPLAELCILRLRGHPIHINLSASFNGSNLIPFSQVVYDATVHWQILSLDFIHCKNAESIFRFFLTQCEKFPSVAPRLQKLSLFHKGPPLDKNLSRGIGYCRFHNPPPTNIGAFRSPPSPLHSSFHLPYFTFHHRYQDPTLLSRQCANYLHTTSKADSCQLIRSDSTRTLCRDPCRFTPSRRIESRRLSLPYPHPRLHLPQHPSVTATLHLKPRSLQSGTRCGVCCVHAAKSLYHYRTLLFPGVARCRNTSLAIARAGVNHQ